MAVAGAFVFHKHILFNFVFDHFFCNISESTLNKMFVNNSMESGKLFYSLVWGGGSKERERKQEREREREWCEGGEIKAPWQALLFFSINRPTPRYKEIIYKHSISFLSWLNNFVTLLIEITLSFVIIHRSIMFVRTSRASSDRLNPSRAYRLERRD